MLVSVAIIDDMGAVAIIALFYTSSINLLALAAAGGIILVLLAFNRLRVVSLWPYLLGVAALWYVTLLSGVHATIAGVVGALLIPYSAGVGKASPLLKLEHALAPWVGFLIVPAFGFANAGVSFSRERERCARPAATGHCPGPVAGQTAGRVRRRLAGGQDRPCGRRAAPAGCRSTGWRCCAASALP